jgi:hypothetical protein
MNTSQPAKGMNMAQVQDSNYRDLLRSYFDSIQEGGDSGRLIGDGLPDSSDAQPAIYSSSYSGAGNMYDQGYEGYLPEYSSRNNLYDQDSENYLPSYSGKSNLDDPAVEVDSSYSDETNRYDQGDGSKPKASPNDPHFKDAVKQQALALDVFKKLGYKSPTFDPDAETKLGAKELGTLADVIYIMSGEAPSDQKDKAVTEFAKNLGFDTFTYAMKQAEKADIFGIGAKMNSAYGLIGALPGVVDSAIKLYDGVVAGNPYKATAGAVGVAAGISGATAPTSLAGSVLTGAAVMAEGLSQAHDFASDTDAFNKQTILNKEENQKYDYVVSPE